MLGGAALCLERVVARRCAVRATRPASVWPDRRRAAHGGEVIVTHGVCALGGRQVDARAKQSASRRCGSRPGCEPRMQEVY
jgi:hypothetical protein